MDELTQFFKMISDETRLRIMVLLYHQRLCVCEICGITGISQPNVSKHLAKLRDKGFVKDERQEQFIFYSLNVEELVFKDVLKTVINNIENYPILKEDMQRLKNADKFLEACKC
ncbi:MAG: metalloregulator ArsR/SmtB family transcription factor [Xylanivirga thermophila]|jgi:ArsR family transcriptional regulator, arsenate/arsenite/antimonite-responsive transcriptional repressor|uniref:ArsR/SmtB family transcription factor n=1 Tax=Xylanivirga thermophila TaxID=2496273 RepID=UPI00101BC84B|nr:metalloregulator ArsR/SmtB family transcription factor [Xylanivirga thermophila]